MTARKRLPCCVCRAPAFPSTGRCLEHDRRRCGWEHGDTATCPKCGAELRIYVEDDYSDDQWPQVVTAAEFAARTGGEP